MNILAEQAACEIVLIAAAWAFVPTLAAAWLIDVWRTRHAGR